MKSSWLGVFFITMFVLISAAREVYIGRLIQNLAPGVLAFFALSVTTLFFLVLNAGSGARELVHLTRRNFRGVLLLNVSTTGSWLFLFFALKHIEPALCSAVSMGLGPVMSLIVQFIFFRERSSPGEKLCALGILVCLVGIFLVQKQGLGGLRVTSSEQVFLGIFFSIGSGLSNVGNIFFSQMLFRGGFKPRQVMAVRFLFLILLSFLLAGKNIIADGRAHVVVLIAIGTIGIGLPLYLMQRGIEKISAVLVTFLLALSPVAVLLFQQWDNRLIFSPFTAIAVAGSVFFVALSFWFKNQRMAS